MIFSNAIFANNKIYTTYTLTSDCVLYADVQLSDNSDNWDVYIKVNEVEAEKLSSFSKNHIKKLVGFNNAKGETVGAATIVGAFSSLFFLSAETKEEALLIKNSLLNMSGKCGHNINEH